LTSSWIAVATVVSYTIAWAAGVPLLVPVFNTLAAFPFMVFALSRGDVRLAVARMLVWALALAACATLLSYARPSRTDALFLRGASYRAEMFGWVLTGRGEESEPSRFIPQQVIHTAVFVALAVASGGVLALAMGAVLMNYMGHYVGSLAAASAHPLATVALGWHPWAGGFRVDRPAARQLLAWAGAGLIADVVLKWLLAPAWQRLLLRVVGW